jgi:hypothetical protein
MTMNQEEVVKPYESQTTMLDHPLKGIVKDVMGWMKWYSKVQMMVVGTSRRPPQKTDKQQVPRSPRKQPIAAIFFPYIPDGVQVKPELLGHIDKLKYLDHDVADTRKFP